MRASCRGLSSLRPGMRFPAAVIVGCASFRNCPRSRKGSGVEPDHAVGVGDQAALVLSRLELGTGEAVTGSRRGVRQCGKARDLGQRMANALPAPRPKSLWPILVVRES